MYCERALHRVPRKYILPFAKQGLSSDLTMHEFADSDHWVPHQRPEEVNRLMKEWLTKKGWCEESSLRPWLPPLGHRMLDVCNVYTLVEIVGQPGK